MKLFHLNVKFAGLIFALSIVPLLAGLGLTIVGGAELGLFLREIFFGNAVNSNLLLGLGVLGVVFSVMATAKLHWIYEKQSEKLLKG